VDILSVDVMRMHTALLTIFVHDQLIRLEVALARMDSVTPSDLHVTHCQVHNI
jgi:hypothetical protein